MMQYTLTGFEVGLADRSHTAVGLMGERWLLNQLERVGYSVSLTHPGERRGDLRVINPNTGEITLIEVKTARRGKDGKWRFTLVKRGKTDHRRADYVALLAVTISGLVVPFLVPVAQIEHQRQAVITSYPLDYNGKLSPFRAMSLHGAIDGENALYRKWPPSSQGGRG